MANSRSMYMEKIDNLADDETVTFTPPFGAHTWQIRLFTDGHATTSVNIQTKDEDGEFIHVDGSPFQGSGGTDDFDASGELELTIDSTNPSIRVDGDVLNAVMKVKCKAYRTLEDVATSGYTAILKD